MAANALLVRWAGGWSEVRDDTAIAAGGRREALLGLGAVHGRDEMDRMARAQLDTYAQARTEVACDLVPVDETDTPYLAFGVGDTVTVPTVDGGTTQDRIVALTVTEDDDGVISFAPEINDVVLRRPERQSQALKKMVDGTMAGDSRVATPVARIQTDSGIYAATAAVAPAGLPPAAKATGAGVLSSGSAVEFPAVGWTISEALSPYLSLDDDNAIQVLQPCDLLVFYKVLFQRPALTGLLLGYVQYDLVTPSTELYIGPFDSAAGATDSSAFESMSFTLLRADADARIRPWVRQDMGVDANISWELAFLQVADLAGGDA